MAGNTSRLNLVLPIGSDNPAELREAITANADELDNAAIILTGTISERPAAAAVVPGTFYRATDSGDISESDGTTWHSLELQANKGVDNGYASLDSTANVPEDQLGNILTCALTQPSRSVGTPYQPNTSRPTHVNAIFFMDSTGGTPSWTASCVAKVGPTSTPADEEDAGYFSTNASSFYITFGLKFIVPAGWYYELTAPVGNLNGLTVTEVTL
jgi:hypothetical protein